MGRAMKDVNPGSRAGFQRFRPGGIDGPFGGRPGQARICGPRISCCDPLDRLEIAGGEEARERGLDDVHVQALELPGEDESFLRDSYWREDCSPSRSVCSKDKDFFHGADCLSAIWDEGLAVECYPSGENHSPLRDLRAQAPPPAAYAGFSSRNLRLGVATAMVSNENEVTNRAGR